MGPPFRAVAAVPWPPFRAAVRRHGAYGPETQLALQTATLTQGSPPQIAISRPLPAATTWI